MAIFSRPDDENSKPKVKQSRTYRPLELTDESVYEHAAMMYTAEQIAKLFKTTKNTILTVHGDAYRRGKANLVNMPRMARAKAMRDLLAWPEDTGLSWAHPEAPFNRLQALADTIENKYGSADEDVQENSLAGVSSEDLEALLNAMGYVRKDSK